MRISRLTKTFSVAIRGEVEAGQAQSSASNISWQNLPDRPLGITAEITIDSEEFHHIFNLVDGIVIGYTEVPIEEGTE